MCNACNAALAEFGAAQNACGKLGSRLSEDLQKLRSMFKTFGPALPDWFANEAHEDLAQTVSELQTITLSLQRLEQRIADSQVKDGLFGVEFIEALCKLCLLSHDVIVCSSSV